jgi:hypothetical protein
MKQACERMDKVRILAATNFVKILRSNLPGIPHVAQLKGIFTEGIENEWTNFNNFDHFVRLISFKDFREPVISGLVFSIGDIGQKSVSIQAIQRRFVDKIIWRISLVENKNKKYLRALYR